MRVLGPGPGPGPGPRDCFERTSKSAARKSLHTNTIANAAEQVKSPHQEDQYMDYGNHGHYLDIGFH